MCWRKLAKWVLRRDLHVCRIVEGCPQRATVADHIEPVSPDTPDSLFFAESNLRAGCREHNIARGMTEPLLATLSQEQRDAIQPAIDEVRSGVVTGDYS